MTVVSVEKDVENLTVVVTAQFDAAPERVWGLWADPRLLERWWGPPSHPASFHQHELTEGAESAYTMTGPDGQSSGGWWHITSAQPPARLEFVDGWMEADGTPNTDPAGTSAIRVDFTEHEGGTRMVVRATYNSLDQLDRLDHLGAIEIFARNIGRMAALL